MEQPCGRRSRTRPRGPPQRHRLKRLLEADIFGLLALAYIAALRTNPPLPGAGPAKELDALAFSFYVHMLASAPRASTTSPT
ncbi:hypothetical protein OHA88_06060 [Streptomyces sp. NBC_00353]|uniref:hypothetical protein n=1 Tax=Streptomyces sp. NBC_00353 TaxID=2975722 RepID=UPI002E25B2DA